MKPFSTSVGLLVLQQDWSICTLLYYTSVEEPLCSVHPDVNKTKTLQLGADLGG